ncbi:MAG TPA: ATP-binding protein [Thermoanaerobaculia bacterium]|nr:ATP-binding protein [Thermoanaerobaculia bacterium]HUM29800.1 ATP-binding protein [Thermoanaerobaculia bacterium]HXK68075.1 ATP-binding protein [Thermoanaerobaculia bacterium]
MPTRILEDIKQKAAQLHATVMTDVLRRFTEGSSDLLRLLDSALTTFENLMGSGTSFSPEHCRKAAGTLEDLLLEMDKLNPVPEGMTRQSVASDLQERIQGWLQDLPKIITLEESRELYRKVPEDPWNRRLRKAVRRCELGIGSAGNRLKRAVLTVVGRKEVHEPALERTLYTSEYLHHFVLAPLTREIALRWTEAMKIVSEDLHTIHTIFEDLGLPEAFVKSEEIPLLDIPSIQSARKRVEACLERHENDLRATHDSLYTHREALLQDMDRAWIEAGTVLLPAEAYSSDSTGQVFHDLDREFNRTSQKWRTHLSADLGELAKDLEIRTLQFRILAIALETMEEFRDRTENKILPNLSALAEVFPSVMERIQAHTDGTDTLAEVLRRERAEILNLLMNKPLPRAVDAIVESSLPGLLRSIPRSIEKAAEILRDRHTIFVTREISHSGPSSKITDIPLRSLATEEFYGPFIQDIHELHSVTRDRISTILNHLSEIDDIVSFTLESAIRHLESGTQVQGKETSGKIAAEGLKRAFGLAQDQTRDIARLGEEVNTSLSDLILSVIDELDNLGRETRAGAMRIRLIQARAVTSLARRFRRIVAGVRAKTASWKDHANKITQGLLTGVRRFRTITGLQRKEGGIGEELSRFLRETQRKLDALPFVYQRVFRFEALEDERFFVGRDHELTVLTTQMETWKQGNFSSTAVVGERGSGRSTLLNVFLNRSHLSARARVLRLTGTLPEPEDLLQVLHEAFPDITFDSLDMLEKELLGMDRMYIVAVEDLQNMFLRTVSGLDTLEHFLLFMSRTQARVFWIVTCTLYSWEYLDRVLNISSYFHKALELDVFDRDELSAILMSRHGVTGFRIVCDEPEDVKKFKALKQASAKEERQSILLAGLIDQLSALAAGNVGVAILFWLRAIREVADGVLRVSPVIDLDDSFLMNLPAEEIFTLAAFLQHETLTSENHALIFHQGRSQSQSLLTRMHNFGILDLTPRGYRIHPFLYRPVIHILRARNVLH